MHVCRDPLPVRILVLVRPEPKPEPADKLGTVRRFKYSGMEAAAGSTQGAVSMVTSNGCALRSEFCLGRGRGTIRDDF